MSRVAHSEGLFELMRSICDLLACMLQVKKVSLLLVFGESDIIQFDSDISEYPSFDITVINKIWGASAGEITEVINLNPTLCTNLDVYTNEISHSATWVKCLKIICLQNKELLYRTEAPRVLVGLMDTKASTLNKQSKEEIIIVRKFLYEVLFGSSIFLGQSTKMLSLYDINSNHSGSRCMSLK